MQFELTTKISAEHSVFVGTSLKSSHQEWCDGLSYWILGDEIEAIKEVDVLTGEIKATGNMYQSSQQRTCG